MRHMLAALLVLLAGAGRAETRREALKLHALFSDHAVFQCGMTVPVWGWAEPGEEVTVAFGDQKKAATAGPDGSWRIRLDVLAAGGPHEMKVSAKSGSVTVTDILVGEVWVGSGQSNMEWSVRNSARAAEEIAAAEHPQIRLFSVPRRMAEKPQKEVQGSWKLCTPETIPGFSAVAYYFGRDLHQRLKIPVGLVHTSWGGTPAEVWTRREVFDEVDALKPCVERDAKALENFEKAAAKAKEENKPAPRKPMPLSCLYNGMIAPLLPYAIRGAIWYQGESNASRAKEYQVLFPAMIENWRKDWGQGNFPFYFVQLANYMARKPQPGDSAWAELREAQTLTMSKSANTGMAVIIDIGEEKDIHPKNKQDVGKRLARWALAREYEQKIVCSGPLYDSMKVEGGKVRLTFKHVGGGLAARDGKLVGFAVAGDDRKFVWADAAIDGDTVVVGADSVAAPVAVRYAWADNPECTLTNKEGLPASPFRTDAWARGQ
jgi:sialate O-acetylesterase